MLVLPPETNVTEIVSVLATVVAMLLVFRTLIYSAVGLSSQVRLWARHRATGRELRRIEIAAWPAEVLRFGKSHAEVRRSRRRRLSGRYTHGTFPVLALFGIALMLGMVAAVILFGPGRAAASRELLWPTMAIVCSLCSFIALFFGARCGRVRIKGKLRVSHSV
jgi:hypothetical protein